MSKLLTEVEDGRMYLPSDSTVLKKRKVVHLETNSKQVLCNNGEDTLDDIIKTVPIFTNNENATNKFAGKKNAFIFELSES